MNAATIIREWSNGARKLELDGIQFTVSHTGRISWATPDGWARIAVDRETFPVMETYTVWQPYGPTYNDEEFTYAGPVADVQPKLDGYGSNYRPWEARPMSSVTLDRV